MLSFTALLKKTVQDWFSHSLQIEYNIYLNFLKKQNPVNYGNHIWLKEGYESKKQFEEDVNYLNADIENLQFSSPGAADTVNGWVANITNGKFDKEYHFTEFI